MSHRVAVVVSIDEGIERQPVESTVSWDCPATPMAVPLVETESTPAVHFATWLLPELVTGIDTVAFPPEMLTVLAAVNATVLEPLMSETPIVALLPLPEKLTVSASLRFDTMFFCDV
jgi:hypothetical protein